MKFDRDQQLVLACLVAGAFSLGLALGGDVLGDLIDSYTGAKTLRSFFGFFAFICVAVAWGLRTFFLAQRDRSPK